MNVIFPILGLFLASTIPALAHNGAVAIAVPVEQIAIDGDFSDWQTRWYPIRSLDYGAVPHDEDDFTGQWTLGYSEAENALYLAVEIHDDSPVLAPLAGETKFWNTQDCCEVYLDLVHRDKDSPSIQFTAHGEELAIFSLDKGDLHQWRESGHVQHAIYRAGKIQRYEWKFDIGKISAGQTHLQAGMSLSVDLAICDLDQDGSFSWLAWGQGIVKTMFPDRRGDAILVAKNAKLGRVQGRIEREGGRGGIGQKRVRLLAEWLAPQQIDLETDDAGHFSAELPTGTYQFEVERGRNSKTRAQLEIAAGDTTEFILAIPPPKGKTVEARPGRKTRAGTGTRYGRWHNFTVADGFANPHIADIVQDRRGHLWFASWSGGAYRYDGRYFTTFTVEDGLADNQLRAVLEDRQGQLWFATDGYGVSRYDGHSFTTFTTEDGLADNQVHDLVEDRQGQLWFATWGGGISRYDGSYFTTFTTEDGLANNTVSALLVDRRGHLWCATSQGGVSRYDGKKFTTFAIRDTLVDEYIYDMAEDAQGNLWFGTRNLGAIRYDGAQFARFTTADGLPSNSVSAIAEDTNGHLWFGTGSRRERGAGLARYDGAAFTTFTTKDGLGGNTIEALAIDSEGSLWIGTQGDGLSRYDGTEFTSFPFKASQAVIDHQGKLWFASKEALYRYDGQSFAEFPFEQAVSNLLSCSVDRQDHIWIGTTSGAKRFDGKQFSTLSSKDGLPSDWISPILQDRSGHMWFGTGAGLSRYDGDAFTHFTIENGLAHNSVYDLAEDREGRIWIQTREGLNTYYDGQLAAFAPEDSLGRLAKRLLLEDNRGHLWFLVDRGGVLRYDGERFAQYATRDGLASDVVNNMLADHQGHLWFATESGISRYDGFAIQNLLRRDGLAHRNTLDMIQDHNGALWFASREGLTRFRPHYASPPIHLSDVVADQRYGPVTEIRLPSSQRYLAFEFYGLSFKTRPEAMLYRYRLVGYDADWLLTRDQRVEYQSLPVGDYTFEIQAINRDLVYSEESAMVRVHIHPPYERIAWLASLTLAGLLIAWQANRLVRRDRRLRDTNEQLQQQARALIDANREVQQAAQAKSQFLANMSHELRTPMNSVINFSSLILEEAYGKISPEIRDAVEEIDHNSENLLDLINDILEISRIESGSVELNIAACVPESCIDTAIATLQHAATQQDLAIVREVADDLPLIQADERRLTQHVLVNLLKNAIKFTERGQIRVGARV